MKYSKVIFTLGVLTVLGIGVIAPFSQAKALTCNDIMSVNATIDKDVYFFGETITGSISVENKLGATIPLNLNVGLYHEDVLEWSRKATVNIPVQGLNFNLADVFDFTPTASSDHIGNWTLKFIVKVGECEWTAQDAFEVAKSELSVCGNGICEAGQGETGFTCPQDCCVDNDGVCRGGCTSANDDDCEEFTIDKAEIVNTLEYYREKGFGDENGAAFYVMAKTWLQSPIENKQEIIDYLDRLQRDDGAWGYLDGRRQKVVTFVLPAYLSMNAIPKKSLDPFFDSHPEYTKWEAAIEYPCMGTNDCGCKYHLVLAYRSYYGKLPPWIDEFFPYCEQDISWTINEKMHQRTHILYPYLYAAHPYPNHDEMIDAIIRLQQPNGSWIDYTYDAPRENTGTQLLFIAGLKLLYPDRADDLQVAVEKSKPYVTSTYKTITEEGEVLGYFRDGNTTEGILAAVCSGLIEGDASPLDPFSRPGSICGNGICGIGETGFTCPSDCCVDGDGVCRDGCTSANDDDCEEEVINKTKTLNYVESKRTSDGGYNSNVFDTSFGIGAYGVLGEICPDPDGIIKFFDSTQADDGSWGAGEHHWGPNTAQALMIYKAMNATPAKPLDKFFEKIDTWEEVVDFVQTYSKGNFWGGIWGAIGSWYTHYEEVPPWWDEYDKAVRKYRDSWEADTHQAEHVMFSYYQVGKYAEAPDFTNSIALLLGQQNSDGSWDEVFGTASPDIGQTFMAIFAFDLYAEYFSVSLEHLDPMTSAMTSAKQYFLDCYHEKGDYAWFSKSATDWQPSGIWHIWIGLSGLNVIDSFCKCGNGVCGIGETYENCPEDCPAEAGCIDTDKGNNIYEKGTTCRPSTVTPGELFCKTDVCLSAHTTGVATSIEHSLIEYYCNGDTMISKTVACANGCNDGACKQQEQQQCAGEGEQVNRNPLMGSIDQQCCAGLVENRVSKSYSICEKSVSICEDLCGDGICQEVVCLATGCPCPETSENCPQDCEIATTICTDTDGGQNIYEKGTTCTSFCQTDVCVSATSLKECYCNGDTMVSQIVVCANGCVDGACAQEPESPVCGDGVCEQGETPENCPQDCSGGGGYDECGNGTGWSEPESSARRCGWPRGSDGFIKDCCCCLVSSHIHDLGVIVTNREVEIKYVPGLYGGCTSPMTVSSSVDGKLWKEVLTKTVTQGTWSPKTTYNEIITVSGEFRYIKIYIPYCYNDYSSAKIMGGTEESDNEMGKIMAIEKGCTDTDGGDNVYEKGTICRPSTVIPGELFCKTDKCVWFDEKVKEYYCDGEEIMSKTVICANGCYDGACKIGRWQTQELGEGGGDIPLRRLPVYGERIVNGAHTIFPSNASIQEKIDIIRKAIEELILKIQALESLR